MRATEPTQLGEFTILEKIGQGAMGAVYKAHQGSLGRVVALKLLPAHYAGDADFVQRFKHEASAAASLNHPNIVQIYAAGQEDGAHYFAMEYVEGESLGARLERKGRVDPREAIAVAHYIALALDYAWRKGGVIHRDIKPDNIFLSREGTVKLGDLGLAKVLGANAAGLTQTGTTMGTPYYVSPEQAVGKKEIDFRADIYSLGCTLFHSICGETPYRGESAMSVMLQHITQPAPKIQTAWPECPPPLIGLLDRMLRKNPEERPESYEVLMQQLTWVSERLDPPSASTAAAMSMFVPMPGERPASVPTTPAARKSLAAATAAPAPAAKGGTGKLVALGAGFVTIAVGLLLWQPWKKPAVAAIDNGAGTPGMATPSVTQSPVAALAPATTPFSKPAATPSIVVAPPSGSFSTATQEAPLVNGLGMKFVPVFISGGPTNRQRVLFSVWETRVQDYEAFFQENNRPWSKPDFAQGPTHPAVGVNWDAATAFCKWLTARERKAGRLDSNLAYRLPSDHEWSCAVGVGDAEDAAKTPEEKNGKLQNIFPWGSQWPPPLGAGNYAGEEMAPALAAGKYTHVRPIPGYRDGFVETAPVGSFKANRFGLYDMGGNAWEWCEDWYDAAHHDKTMRDAPWDAPGGMLSSNRVNRESSISSPRSGFRCVLAAETGASNAIVSAPSAPAPANAMATPVPPPVLPATPPPARGPDAEGFVSLFTPDYLPAWIALGSGGFMVEGGVATSWVTNKKGGVWWYMREPYGDFILKMEFLIATPGGNSGVFVRSPRPDGNGSIAMTEGYQIDVSQDTNPLEMTGAICGIQPPLCVPQNDREWNELEISVVGQHYVVKVNGTLVNDFTGNRRTSGFIGLQEYKVGGLQVRAFRIKEIKANSLPSAAPAVTASTAPAVPADLNSPARWKNAVNLLSSVDLATDTAAGAFTLTPDGLVTGNTGINKLELPYRPTGEYDFRMSFTVKEGIGELDQMLSKGGRAFEWELAGNGIFFGFQMIAGKNAGQNPTGKKYQLQKNRRYTSLVQVRNDGLKAYLDDVPMAEWKTNYSDMGALAHWKLRDDTRLGVGTLNTTAVIHSVEVLELTNKGTLLRPARTIPPPVATPLPIAGGIGMDREGFTSIFNGRDLTGWEGDLRYWSVKAGAITASVPVKDTVRSNTFLVWKGGNVDDFELRFSFKIVTGNSGVQYRSKLVDAATWKVFGYQYEIDTVKNEKNGALYEEGGKRKGLGGNPGSTMMANLGEQIRMMPDDQKQMLGTLRGPFTYHAGGWNEAVIIAQSNHLTQKLNGVTCIEVTDDDANALAKSGVLALQLHAGPPQMVQFKDLRFKRLPSP